MEPGCSPILRVSAHFQAVKPCSALPQGCELNANTSPPCLVSTAPWDMAPRAGTHRPAAGPGLQTQHRGTAVCLRVVLMAMAFPTVAGGRKGEEGVGEAGEGEEGEGEETGKQQEGGDPGLSSQYQLLFHTGSWVPQPKGPKNLSSLHHHIPVSLHLPLCNTLKSLWANSSSRIASWVVYPRGAWQTVSRQ